MPLAKTIGCTIDIRLFIAAAKKSRFHFSSRRFAHTVTVGGAGVIGDDEFGEQTERQGLPAKE
jgi:hypothetical protein